VHFVPPSVDDKAPLGTDNKAQRLVQRGIPPDEDSSRDFLPGAVHPSIIPEVTGS
jgi:hypothetical protein